MSYSFTFFPSTSTSPDSVSYSLGIRLTREDLPLAVEPMIPMVSPLSALNDTWLSAYPSAPGYRKLTSLNSTVPAAALSAAALYPPFVMELSVSSISSIRSAEALALGSILKIISSDMIPCSILEA